ncbi:MAG: aminoacyl-histidine dipeptidase [Roseburia sp.]|nr:aminoacyl-histidine dipeptidase [Roseburia sp.]
MGILSELAPKCVFAYFEEISKIPRGSGNVDGISDYLAVFAREHGLYCVQDEMKNIIIIKEAAQGYEEEPAVILQGHMDMVAVKKPGSPRDMKTQGLELKVEGDMLSAKDTSLGGDDGIAVAYCMALLAAEDIAHPKLEVVLTVDEETGMEGARRVDVSMLQGKRLINLDSEEEGIFLAGCAGGARIKCRLPLHRETARGVLCRIKLDGLQGGHSGAEIDKERGNANVLAGRVLWRICKAFPARLTAAFGGLADNAIPRTAELEVLLPECDKEAGKSEACSRAQGGFDGLMEELAAQLKQELQTRDPGVELIWETADSLCETEAVTVEDSRRAADFLIALPCGVQAMSPDVKGLVETSLNLGIMQLDGQELTAEFSVRSSVESKKRYLLSRVGAVTGLAGGSCLISGDYPGWQYQPDSVLREKMVGIYEKMYGSKPQVEAIHAGVECGFMVDKIPGLDCVSIGPDMKDIHTTEEKLSISSTARVWDFLLQVLAQKECGEA